MLPAPMHTTDDLAEIFDVVDDDDRVIGQATRAEVHARRLKHRAAHVLLFNSRGELFIQTRSATKDKYPGRYDSSASGHLASGEDYHGCAVRELHEELGLTIPPPDVRPVCQIAACEQTGWEFTRVFVVRGDHQPRVNPAEITAGGFWPMTRLRSAVESRPESFAPSFLRVFAEYCRRETVANG